MGWGYNDRLGVSDGSDQTNKHVIAATRTVRSSHMTMIQESHFELLKAQLAEVEAAIQAKQAEEVKVLVDGFAKKLQSLDLSIESAVEELKFYAPKRRRTASAGNTSDEFILYANPADPRQTWGGVGRRPAWVTEFLAKGGSLDRLKV